MKSLLRSRPRVLLVNRCLVLNNEKKVLLLRRAPGDFWGDLHDRMWELPGGKLDVGQDVSHAMEREALEEAGIYVKVTKPSCFVDSFILNSGKYKGLPYIVIIGVADVVGGEVKLSFEHTEFGWFTKKQALDMDITEETKKALLTLLK